LQLMCGGNGEAVVAHDRRAYVFTWGQGDPSATDALTFDRFQEVLRSVQFPSSPLATQNPPPPLVRTFTSARNGFSIGYPAGWTTKAATTSAPSTFVPADDDPGLDVLGDDALRLTITSVRLDPGVSADDWARTFCAFARTKWSPPCADSPGNWERVPIGDDTGWLTVNGDSSAQFPEADSRLFQATAVKDGRAYEIRLQGETERNTFLALLASMHLHPASAVDASAAPSAPSSGSPAP